MLWVYVANASILDIETIRWPEWTSSWYINRNKWEVLYALSQQPDSILYRIYNFSTPSKEQMTQEYSDKCQCFTTEQYGRRETIIRESERRSKAKAKFLEEQTQKHHEGGNTVPEHCGSLCMCCFGLTRAASIETRRQRTSSVSKLSSSQIQSQYGL